MPQLIGLMLVGAGVYAGYKAVVRVSQRVAEELRRAEEEVRRRASESAAMKDLGALERDPASGVYKPSSR